MSAPAGWRDPAELRDEVIVRGIMRDGEVADYSRETTEWSDPCWGNLVGWLPLGSVEPRKAAASDHERMRELHALVNADLAAKLTQAEATNTRLNRRLQELESKRGIADATMLDAMRKERDAALISAQTATRAAAMRAHEILMLKNENSTLRAQLAGEVADQVRRLFGVRLEGGGTNA